MGATAATGLAACDPEPAPTSLLFATVEQCVSAGHVQSKCQASYDEALRAHREKAPRFTSQEECLKQIDVDQCVLSEVLNADGTSSWVYLPLMAGFLLGQATAERESSSGGGVGYGALYRSRDYPGSYRGPGDLATSRQGWANGSPIAAPSRPPNIHTTTISRSGFGSTSYSLGGSSS